MVNGKVQGKVNTNKMTYLKLMESRDKGEKKTNKDWYKTTKKDVKLFGYSGEVGGVWTLVFRT